MLHEARRLLELHIQGKSPVKSDLPWRSDWRYLVHHSLRVEAYARRICQEIPEVNRDMELLVRVAAILHDIAKLDGKKDHAEAGAQIIRKWSDSNSFVSERLDVRRLCRIVTNHSDKSSKDKDICSAILKDADILDEAGAISVFIAQHRAKPQTPDTHLQDILKELQQSTIPYLEKRSRKLQTDPARAIMRRKQSLLELFTAELAEELNEVLLSERSIF